MACYRQLDAAGRPASLIVLLLVLWLPSATVHSQSRNQTVDDSISQAIALAKSGRSEEARRILLSGYAAIPLDKRFPTELAGLAFQQKNYAAARKWLTQAHKLDPSDSYINDFLGTVYFLLENQEAALKYWNKAGKPRISTTSTPDLRIDPVLLDRAVAFAPGDILSLDQVLTTRARLRNLAVFPVETIKIGALPEGNFDVALRLSERNGWGANKWEGLLTTFGGIFGSTIRPQYYNINGSATNVISSYRWHSEKRRARMEVSGPLRRNPKWRYVLEGDLRNENWDVRNYSGSPENVLGSLNLRREAVLGSVRSVENGKVAWSTGGEISHRDFRSITEPTFPSEVLLEGTQLKHLAQFDYEALRVPEHRFVLSTSLSTQAARIWSGTGHSFFKLQGSATSDWLPKAQGDDWQMLQRISLGKIWGDVPFDELYMLGVERDNDLLPLRAHVGTHRGRKGRAPMGTAYVLSNWELDKDVFTKRFVNVKLGPIFDAGKITGPATFGSREWLFDLGAQTKLRVMGAQVTASYAWDMRTLTGAYYLQIGGWPRQRSR